MGVGIKISGGNPVYSVVERYFSRTIEARQYLTEWGVTPSVLNGSNSKRVFTHRGFNFITSHDLPDILGALEELPDNDMAATYRENLTKFRTPMPNLTAARAPDFRNPGEKDSSPPYGRVVDRHPNEQQKPKASSGKEGATITLKHLCQELKLDPSKARQKLRKKFGATGQRYEWTPEEAVKIKEMLAS